ncbi:MoaD/ThiS family protein [Okibacterium endophyticum]
MTTIRYFAAAAEAAGTDEETVGPATLGDLKRLMVGAHGGEFERVLSRCAVLVDGEHLDDDRVISNTATVDILPPFAGG